MKVDIFNVYEKDDLGQVNCEYFGEDRNSAINYLKMRDVILSQEFKDWNKEKGINCSTWRKDGHFINLYFDIQKVDMPDNE